MTESRIIVQPYFGKLPPTFRICYASCQANRSIDWLVATDADTSSLPTAPNIRIAKMDFAQGYDFWGYCDCDLVFGDIRKFARESILERSEKFLGQGHFALFARRRQPK